MRTCEINGCDREQFARGWCQAHYRRWKRNGDPVRLRDRCIIDGCRGFATETKGWCATHVERWHKYGDPLHPKPVKHGFAGTPVYAAWMHMRLRCTDPGHAAYANYGGRCIHVCPEWDQRGAAGFVPFLDHVSTLDHYGEPGYSLDRIDNDGDYEPGNVRWATAQQQARNRRSPVLALH